MPETTLEAIATYGGAVLVELPQAEFATDSPVRDAASALHRYREMSEAFEAERGKILGNTRFSALGRLAELGNFATRQLSKLGRHDAILERAQQQLAELQAEAHKMPVNQRKLLARLRELVDAALTTRKVLVGELRIDPAHHAELA